MRVITRVDHRCRADALVLLKDPIGKHDAISAHLQACIGEVVQISVFASELLAHCTAFQDELSTIVSYGKLLDDATLFAVAENAVHAACGDAETPVKIGRCNGLQGERS